MKYLKFFFKTIFPNAAMTVILLVIAGACFVGAINSTYQHEKILCGIFCVAIVCFNYRWQKKHDKAIGVYPPKV